MLFLQTTPNFTNINMVDIFEKYGWKGLLFVFLIALIYGIAKSNFMAKIMTKISDKFIEWFLKDKTKDLDNVRNITDSDISNHDVFNYIDFWVYSKVPTFQFSTEYRTAVFKKYLTLYLKSYKTNILKFVQSKEYQEMDAAKLRTTLLNLINSIIFDYEREAQDAGIPKIVIEKMKAKNNDTITLTIDLIEGVCSSQFYQSEKNLLKVYSILNIILSVLENTISSSETVCNSINGQLKGLKFIDGDKIYIEP
jgi:hypothetical protein